jgi:hypothetical protein
MLTMGLLYALKDDCVLMGVAGEAIITPLVSRTLVSRKGDAYAIGSDATIGFGGDTGLANIMTASEPRSLARLSRRGMSPCEAWKDDWCDGDDDERTVTKLALLSQSLRSDTTDCIDRTECCVGSERTDCME